MKKILFLFIYILYSYVANSQTSMYSQSKLYEHFFQEEIEEYCCDENACSPTKIVKSEAFEHLIKPVLSNVLTGGSDLVTSTTAASFTNDKDKGSININSTHDIGKTNGWYMNIGAFATSKETTFGIFSNDGWNSNIGLNAGFTYARVGRYFDKSVCESFDGLRKEYRDSMLLYIDSLIYTRRCKLDSMIHAEDSILQLRKRRLDIAKDNGRVDSVNVLVDSIYYLDSLIGTLKIERKKYSILKTSCDSQGVKKQVSDWITTYDTSKLVNSFNGYNVKWINFNIAISNNDIRLDNKLNDSLKNKYAKQNPNNQLELAINFNGNFQHNGKRHIGYYKLSFTGGLTNKLTHPQYDDKPLLQNDTIIHKSFVVNNTDGSFIAKPEDIKPNIGYLDLNIYCAWFFMFKKSIGFDINATVRYSNNASEYPYYHNLSGGPIFLINGKDGYSKGTVGIEFGMFNATNLRSDLSKDFGTRLKIGLPFNVFKTDK